MKSLGESRFSAADAHALARELKCAFVCYYVGPQRSYAFVVTSQTTKAVQLEATESDLSRCVWAVRATIRDADPNKHKKASQYVHDLIWKPVAPLLKGISRIGIVPHAALHSFPFAVLHDGKSYLCSRHSLFYAPSLRSLKRIVMLKQREKKKGVRLLALGNPDHPEGGAGFLKAAEKECEDLSKGFYVSSVLLGAKATESVVKKLPDDVGFLHLSCHGMLSKRGPLESALILARCGPKDAEDGYLRAREILKLDLKRLRFMALSACVTGLGRRSSGDDVLGLTCACFVAGAPTTAASLWPVGDKATYLLFKELYKGVGPKWINLNQKPGYDEAMRRAQLVRMKANPHPRSWAAFQIYGDPRR
jgi:CHAT domain-containing protein